jgi:hypothetical protein
MAHVWFDKLQQVEQDLGTAGLREMQQDLAYNTLIGEYIGSAEHQHLVKYSRVTIIFYAVVDNTSADDCWPCDQAWSLFAKYGLDKVHAVSLGRFGNFDTLADCLCTTFKEVAKSEIAKDEEGNVLYFIQRTQDGAGDRVLSLSKLKTLEYRLFRKMREKLRGYYAMDRKTQAPPRADILKKFAREAKELSDEHELPRPLEYYLELFRLAFDFIEADPVPRTAMLHKEYVTFSEHLLAFFATQNNTYANESSFFYSDVLDKQDSIIFGTNRPKPFIANPVVDPEECKEPMNAKLPVKEKKVVYFVIPFAAAGSGKSYFWNILQEQLGKNPEWSL